MLSKAKHPETALAVMLSGAKHPENGEERPIPLHELSCSKTLLGPRLYCNKLPCGPRL